MGTLTTVKGFFETFNNKIKTGANNIEDNVPIIIPQYIVIANSYTSLCPKYNKHSAITMVVVDVKRLNII